MKQSGEADVVDVMAGLSSSGTGLAPSGYAGVNQSRVTTAAFVRSEAEAFDDAGSEPLDENVSIVDEVAHPVELGGVFEIGENDPAPTQLGAPTTTPGPLNPRHFGTQVGEQHCGVWPGSHAREFDDLDAIQRTRRCLRAAIYHLMSLAII